MIRKSMVFMLCSLFSVLAQEEMTGLKTRIGILNPEVSGGGEKIVTETVELLAKDVSEMGGYDIYKQESMEKAFMEIRERFPKYCRDPRCVAAVGSALQLDRMLYGSVDKGENSYGVSFTLVDVQSRQIIESVSIEGENGVGLPEVLMAAVSKIHGHVDENYDTSTHTYFGKQVNNVKQLYISAGACVVAGLLWAIINNDNIDGEKPEYSDHLAGIGTGSDLIPVCGRPAALGNCYVAASDDAYGVFYNPAGLSWAAGGEAAFGYQYRFASMNNFIASYVNKATREIGFGQGFQYSGDNEGLLTEVTFSTAISYKFNQLLPFLRPLSVGAKINILSKKAGIESVGLDAQKGSGTGFGLDVGMQLELSEKIRGAILFKKIPSFIKYNNVANNTEYVETEPAELLLGGSFQANYETFLICEGNVPIYRDQLWRGKAGIEHAIFRVLRLRFGVEKSEGFDTPWKLNGGLGISVPMDSKYLIIDGAYEYNTFTPFSNVLNFSFRFGF